MLGHVSLAQLSACRKSFHYEITREEMGGVLNELQLKLSCRKALTLALNRDRVVQCNAQVLGELAGGAGLEDSLIEWALVRVAIQRGLSALPHESLAPPSECAGAVWEGAEH